ncbi:peptidoglycan-binding domain-containing protein [Rubellimicrobium aerolatum]|uniref:Peptidoglycan-binding protein n=1 Tax=Rubellimicrobium aerolatum TaxID=490979 RepID=A0ABW0S7Y8_9RHOB|nr:peptidoglycan-binding protein [Rubellimicrobium aerolatum]MBP1804417.1 peptidoglycan hydrolase-like protein with peptidoglycan-binding domain [Rubellimicrobium aerolatum]
MGVRLVLPSCLLALGVTTAAAADDLERILGLGLRAIIETQRLQQAAPSAPSAASPARQTAPRAARASSPAIALAQERLNALGYDAGPPDGQAGQRTQAAIARWQADQGLPATGMLTDVEMARLAGGVGGAAPAPPAEVLPRDEMARLQLALRSLGYDAGTADGVAGRRTGQAIARFLTDRGLDPYQTPIRQAQSLIVAAAGEGSTAPQAGNARPGSRTAGSIPVNLPPMLEVGQDPASGAAMAGGAVVVSQDPWIFDGSPGDDDGTEAQRGALSRLVLLYALKGNPGLLDDPSSTLDFARLLPRAEIEPFVSSGPLGGQGGAFDWSGAGWRGATQFAAEDSRQAFLAAFRDDLMSRAAAAPMTLLDVSEIGFGPYDVANEVLALEVSRVPGGWWEQGGAEVDFDLSTTGALPTQWHLPPAEARRAIEAAVAGFQADKSLRKVWEHPDFDPNGSEQPARGIVLTRLEVRGLRPIDGGILLELEATEAVVHDGLSSWNEIGRLPIERAASVFDGPPVLDALWPRLWRAGADPALLDDTSFVSETFAIRRDQETALATRSDAPLTSFPLVVSPALLGSYLDPTAGDLARMRDWIAAQSQSLPNRVTVPGLSMHAAQEVAEFDPMESLRLSGAPEAGRQGWESAPLAAAQAILPDSLGFVPMGSGRHATAVVAMHPHPAWYGIPLPFVPTQDRGDLTLDVLAATLETDATGAPFVLLDVAPASLAWQRRDESGAVAETGVIEIAAPAPMSVPAEDPAWDVAGVRLGMPLAEAEAAALAFIGGTADRHVSDGEDPALGHRVQLTATGGGEIVVLFHDPASAGSPVTAVGRRVFPPSAGGLEAAVAQVRPSLEAKYGLASGTGRNEPFVLFWAVDPLVLLRLTEGLDHDDPCSLRRTLVNYLDWGIVSLETAPDGPDCGPMLGVMISDGAVDQFLTDTGLFAPLHARAAAEAEPPAPAIKF